MNRYDDLVSRLRAPLANGYVNQAVAFRMLLKDGVSPNVAYLAIKGAVVLNKLQA